MNPQQWVKARELFEVAIELPGDSWKSWLESHCDDEFLRAEVLGMLEADARSDTSGGLLSQVPDLIVDYTRSAAESRIGQRFGAWQAQQLLGEGGMGAVYLAERVEGGFVQRAALKLVRSGFDQAEVLARLSAERQILAGLEHPHIARLLDGGVAAGGEPFLAMEYVEGVNLREYCDAGALTINARLHLFLTVCQAVSYAHARLVVHRDLKPANVLVSSAGEVKLLDFGIAKLIEPGTSGAVTLAPHRMYTPQYAAPEQILGEVTTTAVDVYALGVMLYELLTGHWPYQTRGLTPAAIEQVVLNGAMGRPSSMVISHGDTTAPLEGQREELARLRDSTPQQLQRQLRGDLDAIVLKAMRRQPSERYASVQLLVDDIEAFLHRRPVGARRGNLRYIIGRYLQRHALALGFASLALVGLFAGLGVALWQAQSARREAAISRDALSFMQDLFAGADPESAKGRDVSARELLDNGSRRIHTALVDQPDARVTLLVAMGQAYLGLGLYAEALPLLDEAEPLAALSGNKPLIDRIRLQRLDAIYGLGGFQQVLDELEPLRTAAVASTDAERLRIAEFDFRIGRAAQTLGQTDKAEERLLAALDTRERLLGLAASASQDVVVALVSLYESDGRHQQSQPLAQRAVDALGADGDVILRANAMSALAIVETNVGDLARAEALRSEVLALYRRIYGEDHTFTTGAINNLASVLFAQRRFRDALPMFDQVLAARRKMYAPDHPKIAMAANNASSAHLLTGDAEGSLALAEEALRIRQAAFGTVHSATVLAMIARGSALRELGRMDQAREQFEQALQVFAELFGPDNTQSVSSYNNLARIDMANGQVPADCHNSEQAVTRIARLGAADSLPSLYSNALHLACQWRRGTLADAAPLRAVVASYRQSAAADDPYAPVLLDLLPADAPH
jgi:eukaryotic-like serine/threonine-protein kinase